MSWISGFDLALLGFVNLPAQASWTVDRAAHFFASSHLVKGLLPVGLLWWAWFRGGSEERAVRERLVATLLGCILALALARMLAVVLPFRPRPMHQPDLPFVLPHGSSARFLEAWSSFPSDHAVMFFCLGAGLLFVSKVAGVVALAHAVVVVALPRVYLGLHYPTDIAAGAALGALVAVLAVRLFPGTTPVKSLTDGAYARPGLFYPLFFAATYQVAEMFASLRFVASFAQDVIRAHSGA